MNLPSDAVKSMYRKMKPINYPKNLILAALVMLGVLIAWQTVKVMPSGSVGDTRPNSEATFRLTTQTGQTFTERDLLGKPHLVFFGFTHCPDICPTTLAELTVLMEKLGPDADKLLPIMISVDPERDTQAILKAYLSSFDRRIVALTGSGQEIDKAIAAFKAFARRVPIGDSDYTMDHTAGVLLRKADGSMGGVLDMHESEDVRLEKLRRLVRSAS